MCIHNHIHIYRAFTNTYVDYTGGGYTISMYKKVTIVKTLTNLSATT